MKVVLYQPQIPQNTGNIVRTCAVTHTELLLVKPLGFSMSARHLKRAGLDYWNSVNPMFTNDLFADLKMLKERKFYFFSSHATPYYSDIRFSPNDLLIFGSETGGIAEEFWTEWPEKFYTVPMSANSRCLNLANTVSIVLYEALRQQNFFFTQI